MIIAIVQARLSSNRLPGKVLRPILGRPMLALQLERLHRWRAAGRLLVATSDQPDDHAIAEMCSNLAVPCFRGNLNDVLDRFYQAARGFGSEHVIRLTGDCPLIDPELIEAVVDYHLSGDFDYSSNALEPTYPDGLDVEVMRWAALEEAWRMARLPSEREHVTPYIYQHPERFRIGHYKNEIDLSTLRWTVDEVEDFNFVRQVYELLYPANPSFTTEDILALLRVQPELTELNAGFKRNEGILKSLELDKLYRQRLQLALEEKRT